MLWRWRSDPLVAAKLAKTELPAAIARARREFAPDVAFVEMAQLAQFLPALAGVPTILTDHEAGCPANTHTGLGPHGDARDRRLWWRYVDRWYPLADQLQALTTEDAAVLSQRLGRPVAVRPPTYRSPANPKTPAAAPPRALFLGDYSHGPNPEAARRLATEVLPLIRTAAPDAELWLAGRHSERIAELANVPGVHVAGFVDDLDALLTSVRVVLAPAYSGGGIRTKCFTGLAHGLPVVTNALGARGLPVPEPAMFVGESPQELSSHTVRLLTSDDLVTTGSEVGFAWARENASAESVGRQQAEFARQVATRAAATAD